MSGDSVTWKNTDTADHQVMVDNSTCKLSLEPGQSSSCTFATPGTFKFQDPTAKGAGFTGTLTVGQNTRSVSLTSNRNDRDPRRRGDALRHRLEQAGRRERHDHRAVPRPAGDVDAGDDDERRQLDAAGAAADQHDLPGAVRRREQHVRRPSTSGRGSRSRRSGAPATSPSWSLLARWPARRSTSRAGRTASWVTICQQQLQSISRTNTTVVTTFSASVNARHEAPHLHAGGADEPGLPRRAQQLRRQLTRRARGCGPASAGPHLSSARAARRAAGCRRSRRALRLRPRRRPVSSRKRATSSTPSGARRSGGAPRDRRAPRARRASPALSTYVATIATCISASSPATNSSSSSDELVGAVEVVEHEQQRLLRCDACCSARRRRRRAGTARSSPAPGPARDTSPSGCSACVHGQYGGAPAASSSVPRARARRRPSRGSRARRRGASCRRRSRR